MQREQRVTVWPAGPRSSAEPAGMLQSPRWEGRSRSQGLGGPPLPPALGSHGEPRWRAWPGESGRGGETGAGAAGLSAGPPRHPGWSS